MYDFKIVGAGLFGAVFAERLASIGKKVLIVDKRPHIGGNCYTEKIESIDVHKYGPHIFHTNSDMIWNYINNFAQFNDFKLETKANYYGAIYSLPINLNTFEEFFGVSTEEEARLLIESKRLKINNPSNLEEWILSQVGEEIYETLIQGYTTKQWCLSPKELPASIIQRLPIRFNRDNNYFNDKYQGIPINGYTNIFYGLLKNKNIDVRLGEDFDHNWRSYARKLLYTGPIDEYYNFKYGPLEYRGVRFESKIIEGSAQDSALVNYTDFDTPFTRQIEHKLFAFKKHKKSVVTREYPLGVSESERFYPLRDKKNTDIYNKYLEESKKEDNVLFGGRLASYQYWNMDQTIGSSLKLFSNVYN